jgi:hypothetical protein
MWTTRLIKECRLEEGGLKASTTAQSTMDVLTIDVGAPHVKILGRGQKERREFEPGPKLTPKLKHDNSTDSLIQRYRKMRDTL